MRKYRYGLIGLFLSLMILSAAFSPVFNFTVVPPTNHASAQVGFVADAPAVQAWTDWPWLCSPQGVLKKTGDFKTEQDYKDYQASTGSKPIPQGSKCTMWSPSPSPSPSVKPTSPPAPTNAPTIMPVPTSTKPAACIITDIIGEIKYTGDHVIGNPFQIHLINKATNPDCLANLWLDVFGSMQPETQKDGWLQSQKNNFIWQEVIPVPPGTDKYITYDFVHGGADFCWKQFDLVRTDWLPGKDEIPAYNGTNMADYGFMRGKGCQPTPVPTTVPTRTATPTNTTVPTNTPTPTATATKIATATNTPVPSVTAGPTNTPAPMSPTATTPPSVPPVATDTPTPVVVTPPPATAVPTVPPAPTPGSPAGTTYTHYCEWVETQGTNGAEGVWTPRSVPKGTPIDLDWVGNLPIQGSVDLLPTSEGRVFPFKSYRRDVQGQPGKLATCGPMATPSPTPKPPTATPIPPTATATATPSPTPTMVPPTATPTDTAVPTATPTATLEPTPSPVPTPGEPIPGMQGNPQ